MSTLSILLSTFRRFGFFSLILVFVFMSCEKKTEMDSLENSKKTVYPLIPSELAGQEIDTIITFDPNAFEESVSYEIHDPERFMEGDTIITFDPATYEESMVIVEDNQGQVDTIITFDPETLEETVHTEVNQSTIAEQEVDTIITFNPKTFEESMTVIKYTNGKADTTQVY